MNLEKELRKYEREAYTEKPVKHDQTCFGYGMMAVISTLALLICAGALLGVAEQRKKFNSTLQETVCFVDSSIFQSSNVILAVHYQTVDQMRVDSTKTFDYPRHYFSISDSFTCYYKKTNVRMLHDWQNESILFIPSMICFALSIVPVIAIVAYYFIYWKKLVAENPPPEKN